MIEAYHLQTPWPAEWWDEIDSTSLEAQRRALRGYVGPAWFAAKAQTAGKGRLGRRWISETGNLYTTALLPLKEMSPEIASLSLTVGLAVRDVVVEVTQGRVVPGLKWPNDVRVDGAKLCGILLEAGKADRSGHWLSVGIGLNIAFAPQIPDYKTVSLRDLDPDLMLNPEAMLDQVDRCLRYRLIQHIDRGLGSITKDWSLATDQWGQSYSARIGQSVVSGEFAGLDPSGELLLKQADGMTVRVSAGDVVPLGETT